MNTSETSKIKNELTESDINNVLAVWDTEDKENFNRFNSLVSLGDSRALAMATCISMKFDKKENYDFYYKAYCL